ncbi:MAG TPA: HAMP domain-containing sensor histidine kinase [Leptospiraceae bacterium]|nr:HAMP domain-containing sensor histidine kinase [Leptospiraceae bacterium]HMX32236.1 HAMP domain-containing sensor histidine kinase [Leptospiraceae bacterium]HNA06800.1 HAMP domain-containing sensor histidine kinase [Leptospiraceae bacterium]HNB99834.1 HAMP domain-containing sensor histidine kinase [Leptospiraceae bacterium]HNE08003.1 HAMP domain-containing sensor histidine kinase [Leptospiraceae bacterium]
MILKKIKNFLKNIVFFGIKKVPNAHQPNLIFFNITNSSILAVILVFIITSPLPLNRFEWILTYLFLFLFALNFLIVRLFNFQIAKRILALSMNLTIIFLMLKEKDLEIYLLFDIFVGSATFFLFNLEERKDVLFFTTLNVIGLLLYFFVDIPFIEYTPRNHNDERLLTIIFAILSFSTYCFGLYTFLKINARYEKVLGNQLKSSRNLNYKLQKALRENELLYHTLNHDIKNPLSGILGMQDLLNRLLIRKNIHDPDLNRYLLSLFEANSRALKIVQDFSNISEIITNTDTNLTEIHLLENLQSLVDNFSGVAFNKNLQFEIICKENIKIKINVNSLNRVLENLISNALKFTPRGKKITLSVTLDQYLYISFIDEGIGIPERLLKRIFDLTSTKKRNGLDNEVSTGLGLYICKELMQKLNGTISVESTEGKGSNFTLSLPASIICS